MLTVALVLLLLYAAGRRVRAVGRVTPRPGRAGSFHPTGMHAAAAGALAGVQYQLHHPVVVAHPADPEAVRLVGEAVVTHIDADGHPVAPPDTQPVRYRLVLPPQLRTAQARGQLTAATITFNGTVRPDVTYQVDGVWYGHHNVQFPSAR